MSVPEERHPIDPVSERLGELRADVRGIKERLATLATAADVVALKERLDRFEPSVYRLLGGLYLLVVLGFSALAWIGLHAHGG
jgi:hypothetical protein